MAEWIMKEETDMDGVGCYIRKGELIRCKDCRFYAIEYPGANPEWHLCRRSNCERLLNDFCSRAERKEE